jgi:hypothetical protein
VVVVGSSLAVSNKNTMERTINVTFSYVRDVELEEETEEEEEEQDEE